VSSVQLLPRRPRALILKGVQLDSPVAFFRFELERRIRLERRSSHQHAYTRAPVMASHDRASASGSASSASNARRSKNGASSARISTPVDPNTSSGDVKESVPANIINVDAVADNVLSTLNVCSIRVAPFKWVCICFADDRFHFAC
jgi:hypothetical protein